MRRSSTRSSRRHTWRRDESLPTSRDLESSTCHVERRYRSRTTWRLPTQCRPCPSENDFREPENVLRCILSLRSLPRRVRDAVRRQMRCGRCAWGCQHSTDRWARTRRAESLRPFSRAREHGGRSACLAPDVLGRPRPALRTGSPRNNHRLRNNGVRQRTVPRRGSDGPGFVRRPRVGARRPLRRRTGSQPTSGRFLARFGPLIPTRIGRLWHALTPRHHPVRAAENGRSDIPARAEFGFGVMIQACWQRGSRIGAAWQIRRQLQTG